MAKKAIILENGKRGISDLKTINSESLFGAGNIILLTDVSWGDIIGTLSDQTDLQSALDDKQDTLVAETNIRNLNTYSLLGSGSLLIASIEGNPLITDSVNYDYQVATINGNDIFNSTENFILVGYSNIGTIDGLPLAGPTITPAWSVATINGNAIFNSSTDFNLALAVHTHVISDITGLQTALDTKQETLVSGTNIKTLNSLSLLGSGDIDLKTINSEELTGTGNITVLTGVAWGDITGTLSNQTDLQNALDAKQATLISGTNIKTVETVSLLGAGDIPVATINGINIWNNDTDFEVTNLPYGVQNAMLYYNSGTWQSTAGKMEYNGNIFSLFGLGVSSSVFIDPAIPVLQLSDGGGTPEIARLANSGLYQSNKVENVNCPAVWNPGGELMHLDKNSCTLISNQPLTTVQTTFFPLYFNIPKGLKANDTYRVHVNGKIGINIDAAAINQDFHITPVLGSTGIVMTAEPFGIYRREYMPTGGVIAQTDYYANRHDWNLVQVDLGTTRSGQLEETYLLEIDFIADVVTDSTYTNGNVGIAFHNPSGLGNMILQEGSFVRADILGDSNKNS